MNSLSWLVGLRYLSARKGSRFVSLFSFASIVGMAVSVMAMVLVLSVMNGFEGEMRNRILHAVPHAQITASDGIADWQLLVQQLQTQAHQPSRLLAAAPQDRARVLLESDSRVRGGEMFGVDPVLEAGVSQIDRFVTQGEWQALQLQVEVGDSINIMLPRVSVTPLGLFPRSRRFTVVGIFSVGAQLDSSQLYVHLDDAGRLLRTGGRVDALRLRFDDVMRAPEELESLRVLPVLSGFELKSWRDENRTLFNAIRMEKIMVSLMLSVIIAVAVFNLVSILTMAVADRRNDIAVLRTIGASRGAILAIFLIYGMAMGVAGIGMGALMGTLLSLNVGAISAWLEKIGGEKLMDSQMFFIAHLPSEWRWEQVFSIVALALALCAIAVFYPAWRASKIHPAEALRYE